MFVNEPHLPTRKATPDATAVNFANFFFLYIYIFFCFEFVAAKFCC